MASIGFYGSHNAALAIEKDGEITHVVEVERILNYKNSGVAQYKTVRPDFIHELVGYIKDYIIQVSGIEIFDKCYYMNTDVVIENERFDLHTLIPAKEYVYGLHHQSHAAGSFYQSPYKEALIFSFDGGGNDGFFNVYLGKRDTSVELLESVLNPKYNTPHIYYDLGFPYMLIGHYLNDIKQEPLSEGNLVYPGKIMGLVSFGNVKSEWLPKFINFYKQKPDGSKYVEYIEELGKEIGVEFDIENRLEGQLAYDIAATSQKAFEECFLEVAKPYFDKYPDLPVILSGGCALNIILNTRVKQEFNKEVFIGPNPNDCGLAAGLVLHNLRPEHQIDLTYSGIGLLDYNNLGNYLQNINRRITVRNSTITKIVSELRDGKIIGVVRGRAEHGPRALGNRSIICDPSIKEMKDILNAKVKHREWYRPFAPVVRLEDISEYFEWDTEARWMSFCPTVKSEWRKKLPSITHIDNTARVQTVTREQNPWLYDLLTEFKKETGVGVLLNTSFNVNGKPILSTIHDAFKIFNESQMDSLIIENYHIFKQ